MSITWKFVMFVFVLLIIYLTNNAETNAAIREKADLEREVQEIKYEYITTESELMNMSKQSEVLNRIERENLGLKDLTEPPRMVDR